MDASSFEANVEHVFEDPGNLRGLNVIILIKREITIKPTNQPTCLPTIYLQANHYIITSFAFFINYQVAKKGNPETGINLPTFNQSNVFEESESLRGLKVII